MAEQFVKMIENSLNENWEKNALANYQNQPLSYGDIAEKILFLHALFQEFNVKEGDSIAVIGKNSVNWAIVYLAVVTYGAVIVPILPDFHASDIQHIINHSDSVLFFSSPAHFEQIDENQIADLQGILSLEDFSLLHSNKKNCAAIIAKVLHHFAENPPLPILKKQVHFPDFSPEKVLAIVYTSGTTGFSKGVMLPQRSLTENMNFAQRNMPLKAGDKIVSFMPLAHAYGCAFEFLFPFTLGCYVTFLDKIPSPKIIVKAFQEIRPELILSVPLIIEKIYNKQIKPIITTSKMKILLQTPGINKLVKKKICQKLTAVFGSNFHEIVIGGAALNEEVEAFLTSIGFHFTIGYGMTECGPLISYCSWNKRTLKTCGKLVHSLELKIDSADPHTEVGEILVRGENLLLGYYKNEEATRETIDENGWLHTGDLGIIDQQGFVYIKGRKKNMILGPSGQNIYPESIEAQLNNLPFIQESLVVEENGKIVAFVYPDMEKADKENYSEPELQKMMEKNRAAINEKMAAHSKISKIKLFPEEFEKTPTKKIKRFLYIHNQ
jgi:long-chain acyl-CoA synthetase